MLVNIQDDILKIQALGLLDRLLVDKTTKKNIMWATDAYASLGELYSRNEEITSSLITGFNSDVIKTRARKALEQQSERTKKHAEVFTPLWICKKMNDYADEMWFDRKDVFTKDGVPTEHIEFEKSDEWKKYVDSRRLEITCGEAPYLVSRYDVESGEYIPPGNRIGMLDRKLRVINENTSNEQDWIKWAIRAFQATYGYEFQGDNLLIARVNILMTFDDYVQERWGRKPTGNELRKLINIVTWNIWQMDGLTGTIPYAKAEEHNYQMTLIDMCSNDEDDNTENKQPLCRIYDWRAEENIEFISLRSEYA